MDAVEQKSGGPANAAGGWALSADALSKHDVGMRLGVLREWCGVSRRGLARKSGVSESTLRRSERHGADLTPQQILAVALALRPSLDLAVFLAVGRLAPTAAEVAEMGLRWKLDHLTPRRTTSLLRLIEGILSELGRRRAA